MQNEYSQLRAEFGRIAAVTKFNGLELLHGSKRGGLDSLNFQVGTDGSSSSSLNVALGDSGIFSGVIDISQLTFTATDILGSTGQPASSLEDYFGQAFLRLDDSTYVGINRYQAYGSLALFVYKKDAGADTYSEVSADFLSFNSSTGAISASSVSNALQQGVDLRALTISDSTGQYGPNLGSSSNIDFARIDTQSYARNTLDTVRRRADELSQLIGKLGASESRLKTTQSVNSTFTLEYGAAASRIQDVDVAEEAAKLIAAQVRQQAAARVLQSANLEPQLALKLLKG